MFVAVGAPLQAIEMVNRGGVTPSHTTRPIERLDITGDVVIRDTVAVGWLPEGSDPMGNGEIWVQRRGEEPSDDQGPRSTC